MTEKDVEKMTMSRRRYVKYGIRGIGAVLVATSIPSFLPNVKADAQESPSSPIYSPYPKPLTDFSKIVPDSTPELNIADLRHPLHNKFCFPVRFSRDTPNPGTGDFGTDIKPVSGVLGVYAMQEVRTDLSLPAAPPDRTLYAPTLECPNKASLESVTSYHRYSGMSGTGRNWGVWNHVTGGWVVFKAMDSTWLSIYTRVFAEGRMYSTKVIKLSGAWKVLLYNYNTSSWEVQYSDTRERSTTNGWDIWESWFNQTCPTTIPNIESKGLQVYVNGYWYPVNPTYGQPLNTMYCLYPKGWKSQYDWWYVN